MQILTEIGEVGVHVGDDHYVLRPSLYAMTRLGEPSVIVSIYVEVMGDASYSGRASQQMLDALAVLYACSDIDVSGVFGYFNAPREVAGGKFLPGEYVAGLVPVVDILPLARCLLKHGVVGALPQIPRRHDDDPEYVSEFVARDHVALAMAHLGVSERDAWNMTMTSLIGALRAKFPQQESSAPGAKAPTKEQHDATMEWFDKIEAKRKSAQGAH